MINPFKRKPTIDLESIHQYVDDITSMQEQRKEALFQGMKDEVEQLDHNIEIALKVQEHLLEQIK